MMAQEFFQIGDPCVQIGLEEMDIIILQEFLVNGGDSESSEGEDPVDIDLIGEEMYGRGEVRLNLEGVLRLDGLHDIEIRLPNKVVDEL